MEKIRVFTRELYQLCYNYGDKNRVPVHSTNTCGWFLEHPNFVRWKQSTEPSAIWVTADAGCGKSVLAKFLIGQLLSDNHTVIHFFFHHGRYGKNVLLCALLHQLLTHVIPSDEAKSSAMLHMLSDELEYKGEKVMNEDEILWKIICNATTGSKHTSSKLFCVIDGLDECEDASRSPFIDLVVSTFSSSGTARQPHQPPNFLITSRPYPVIEESFRPLSQIRLRLENETPAVSNDIETMIIDNIQKLNPTRFPSKVQKYLHTEISRRAGRTFLWVKLIFDALEQLDSTTKSKIGKLLDTNPSELDALYESSLSAAKNRERTRRLLQILLVATRPLRLDEVNVALQIQEACVCFEDIELEPDIEGAIKRLCGSVIRIANSTVDFMHQTAKEFLTTSQSTLEQSQDITWGASINVAQSHCVLGSICLWYLALGDLDEKFPLWIQTHAGEGFCFYEYAGKNWPHHSEEVLKRVRRAHEAGFEPDPDSSQLQALLTLLRESGMSRIRRCINTRGDPFIFLEGQGFHSVVNWFLNGERIEGYPDDEIFEAICDALGKKRAHSFIWPLLQYAETIIANSEQYSTEETNKIFSRIASAAAQRSRIPVIEYLEQKVDITFQKPALSSGLQVAVKSSDYSSVVKLINWGAKDHCTESLKKSLVFYSWTSNHQIRLLLLRTQGYRNAAEDFSGVYQIMFARHRIDQGDQGAEQSETFESFLRHVMDMPLDNYIYALLEAIRWRHPSVSYLIRSRMDLACATKEDNERQPQNDSSTQTHCALHEVFSVACRYGGPAAYLLFEHLGSVIDVNRTDAFGITPLVAAILADDYSLCEWLLQKKANTNVCVRYNMNANTTNQWEKKHGLTVFGKRGSSIMPLSLGFTVHRPRDWEWTGNYLRIPDVWKRYGGKIFNGCPLTEALRLQNPQIFELLIKYGGDPWQSYETGKSVLEAVAASHSEEFFDRLVDPLRTTTDIDSFEIDTPEMPPRKALLYIAAKSGFWNSVIKLASNGPIVNVEGAKRETPLHWVASFPPAAGRVETFKKLVEYHDANANITNSDGETALDLLERSISSVDVPTQDQDHIQTWNFLETLRNYPSYLPSVKRTVAMLRRSQRSNGCSPAASISEEDLDLENSSDELDPGSGLGGDVDPETMSDIRSNGDERSDVDDHLDSLQPVSGNTSASQPHEERGLFPWLFLC